MVEHGAVVLMESTLPTSWHLDKTPLEWPAPSLHHLLALVQGIFDVCLLRYFWPSIQSVQQVGFCGKTPKGCFYGGELSSQAVHLLSADLDLGSFNATIVIESETAGCIDTLTPWGSVRLEIHDLKQVMFIDASVPLWLESCFSTSNTTNNKSLSTVYSLRLIDTRLDSHWKLSNTFCKRTKHLSKRVPPSGVNQPIAICSYKKSIESLRAGYLAKAFKARPGHETKYTKWNNHGFFSAFLVGFFARNSGAKRDGQIGHIELWGSSSFEPRTLKLLLGSVDFQIPIGFSLILTGFLKHQRIPLKNQIKSPMKTKCHIPPHLDWKLHSET